MSYVAYNSATGNDLIDSITWGGYWDLTTSVGGAVGTITYSLDDGYWGGDGWFNYEISAIRDALEVWSNVCAIDFVEVDPGNPNDSNYWENITFVALSESTMSYLFGSGTLGAHDTPGDETYLSYYNYLADYYYPLGGYYNWEGTGWTEDGLQQGGYGFATLIHEIGHGLGFAHPHDNGGISTVMDGVSDSLYDYGTDELNQGIFTTMSYNDGWMSEFGVIIDYDYGVQGTPMAFDIYLAQILYGANEDYNVGANAYYLPEENASGTFWSCIWDAGGEDTISAIGISENCIINLNDAPLTGENAGGFVSYANNVMGGFTIAYGVVIENAIGGVKNDSITGNEAANDLVGGNGKDTLYGGNGKDILAGGAGADELEGGAGKDVLYGGNGADTFVFTATRQSSATATSADVIKDFIRGTDTIDLSAIDASTKLSGNNTFTFDGTTTFGTSSYGEVYYKKFDLSGTSNDYTMVYIDTDNDPAAEMTIKLMGLHNLTASDFVL